MQTLELNFKINDTENNIFQNGAKNKKKGSYFYAQLTAIF